MKYYICIPILLFLTVSIQAQQGLENPGVGDDGFDATGFYANPNEKEEREKRNEDYKRLYDEELADSTLTQNQVMQKIFAPRVYDELFDTNLPGQRKSGQWSFDLNPRFSDFFGDEYVRFPFGARYNISKQLLIFSELGTYFANPFDNYSGSGLYKWKVGGKYSWMNVRKSGWNMAVGFKANMPLDNPPIQLSDAYARYEPYISVSRQLTGHPKWLVYFNMAYQVVEESPFEAEPIQPQPKDRLFLRPGFIYYPGGNFRYSFELEYRTNALDFREQQDPIITQLPSSPVPEGFRRANWILATEEVHEVIALPGITWFPTRETREGLFIPGNWDVGVEVRIPLIEQTGEDFGANVRFRWYYDYRQLVAKDLPSLFKRDRE